MKKSHFPFCFCNSSGGLGHPIRTSQDSAGDVVLATNSFGLTGFLGAVPPLATGVKLWHRMCFKSQVSSQVTQLSPQSAQQPSIQSKPVPMQAGADKQLNSESSAEINTPLQAATAPPSGTILSHTLLSGVAQHMAKHTATPAYCTHTVPLSGGRAVGEESLPLRGRRSSSRKRRRSRTRRCKVWRFSIGNTSGQMCE